MSGILILRVSFNLKRSVAKK